MSQAGQNAKSAVSGALPGSILEHSEFLKNLPGGVCVFHVRDGAWILDLVNDSWGRVHHLSAAGTKEMIGRDLLEKIVPEDRDDLRKQLEKADGSADGIAEATSRLQQEDGTCSWVCVQIRRARVREESAGCPCYYAVSTDVTGRVQAEEKLAESESTLREAVGIADILFFTYYPEKSRCEMRTANPRYAQLPSVWENFPDDFLVYLGATPKDRGACHEMLGKIAAGAENGECVLCTKQQGIDRWLRLHVTAVRDGAGGKAGAGTVRIQGYVLNVSDRVGAAEQFRREQLRVKTLEGSAFEAFSFCLTREAPIALQTRDTDMQKTKVTDDMVRELLQIDPLMTKAAPETRNVLIRVGMRIPDPDERRKFYTACGGTALRRMLAEGIFVRKLRVRRRVGSLLRWVLCRIELVQDPDSGDFFAFFYSSDINEKVTSEQVLSHVMSINYEEVSCYDLQSGRVQSIREQDEKDGNAERNYIQMLEETVSGALSGEQEQLRRRLSLGNILEKLKDLPVYTMFYTMQETREDLPGDPHRQMKMDILFLNAHRDELLFLRTDVTEITERDREYKMQMADALTAAKAASAAKTNSCRA
jgi:PAS domain S-box-containing protein